MVITLMEMMTTLNPGRCSNLMRMPLHQGNTFPSTMKYLLYLEGANSISGLIQVYQCPTHIHVVLDCKPFHMKRLHLSNIIHEVVSSMI